MYIVHNTHLQLIVVSEKLYAIRFNTLLLIFSFLFMFLKEGKIFEARELHMGNAVAELDFILVFVDFILYVNSYK